MPPGVTCSQHGSARPPTNSIRSCGSGSIRSSLTEGLVERTIAHESVDAAERLYVRACFARLCRNSLLAVAREMESTTRGLRTLANLVSTSLQLDLPRGTPLATIEELLRRMQGMHPRMAQLTELRLFGEFTLEECAAELGISVSTAKREWVYAKSFVSQQAAQFQGSSARLLPPDPTRNQSSDPHIDGHQT